MTTIKGCKRGGKFFLKKEAVTIDKVEPEKLRNKIIELWPTANKTKISDNELKSLIQLKITHDPSFREWFKTELKTNL